MYFLSIANTENAKWKNKMYLYSSPPSYRQTRMAVLEASRVVIFLGIEEGFYHVVYGDIAGYIQDFPGLKLRRITKRKIHRLGLHFLG